MPLALGDSRGDHYHKDSTAIAVKYGYTGLTHVCFNLKGVDDDYLVEDRKSTINGATIAFREATSTLRTLVLIRRTVVNVSRSEFKYAFKLIALLHEIGHVKDWEQGVNLKEGDVAILDAEVFANEYALRKLMEGDYRVALNTFMGALEKVRGGRRLPEDHRRPAGGNRVVSDVRGVRENQLERSSQRRRRGPRHARRRRVAVRVQPDVRGIAMLVLPPHLIELTHNARLKSFWRKKVVRAFLRRSYLPELGNMP